MVKFQIMDKKIFFSLYDAKGDMTKRWFIRYYQDGKRVFHYGTINHGTTPEERYKIAAREEKALAAALNKSSGTASEAIKRSVYSYVERNSNRWRKKTYMGYVSRLNVFFEWLADKPLSNESTEAFFQYMEHERGSQSNTLRGYRVNLYRLFKAVGYGKFFESIEHFKKKTGAFRYFTLTQIAEIGKEMQKVDPVMWMTCQMQFYMFIRPGEMRMLKVNDVMLDEKQVHVSASVSKNGKKAYLPIPKAFLGALTEYLKDRKPGEFLFPSPKDVMKPVPINFYSVRHQYLIQRLGYNVDEYKYYSWKHSGAVCYVRNNGKVKQLQLLMRHHSLQMTDIYLSGLGVLDIKEDDDILPSI